MVVIQVMPAQILHLPCKVFEGKDFHLFIFFRTNQYYLGKGCAIQTD